MNCLKIIFTCLPLALYGMGKDTPHALGIDVSVGENQSITASLKNNVSGGKKPYTFTQIKGPQNNFAEIEIKLDGTIEITAKNNFTGTTEFEYKAIDAQDRSSNTAKIVVHIQ